MEPSRLAVTCEPSAVAVELAAPATEPPARFAAEARGAVGRRPSRQTAESGRGAYFAGAPSHRDDPTFRRRAHPPSGRVGEATPAPQPPVTLTHTAPISDALLEVHPIEARDPEKGDL